MWAGPSYHGLESQTEQEGESKWGPTFVPLSPHCRHHASNHLTLPLPYLLHHDGLCPQPWSKNKTSFCKLILSGFWWQQWEKQLTLSFPTDLSFKSLSQRALVILSEQTYGRKKSDTRLTVNYSPAIHLASVTAGWRRKDACFLVF